MPLQGFRRFRKHQWGKQSSFASNTSATRVLPWRGPIVVDPAREDPDVDTGSIDPIMQPLNGPQENTASLDITAFAFDDAPYLYAAAIKGGVTPTGATAKSWVFQAASLTADDFDYFTDQWGDDVTNDLDGATPDAPQPIGGTGELDATPATGYEAPEDTATTPGPNDDLFGIARNDLR